MESGKTHDHVPAASADMTNKSHRRLVDAKKLTLLQMRMTMKMAKLKIFDSYNNLCKKGNTIQTISIEKHLFS